MVNLRKISESHKALDRRQSLQQSMQHSAIQQIIQATKRVMSPPPDSSKVMHCQVGIIKMYWFSAVLKKAMVITIGHNIDLVAKDFFFFHLFSKFRIFWYKQSGIPR